MAATSGTKKNTYKKRHGLSQPSKPLGPKRKQFKDTKTGRNNPSDPHIPPQISSALLADDDGAPDFPRGGGRVSSRSEVAELYEETNVRDKKRSKDKKKGGKSDVGGDDDWASLFGGGVSGKLPRFANRVTVKNISSDMRLWGVVVEVNSKDLVIGLPGGLRGFVRLEDACDFDSVDSLKDLESDVLSNIFHIGQLVSCIVLRVEDDKMEGKANRRILLSLRLSLLHKYLTLDYLQDGMALNAVVKSVEDHGYILHFGCAFSGFLAKECKDGGNIKLKAWQLVHCVVKRIDRDRSFVYVTTDADLASKCPIKDLKGITIDSLVPGMMVYARLHAVLENGLMFSFLSYFTGTVDIFNLENQFPTTNWKDDYHQNQKFKARIVFIDPTTRAIGLTLNPHLVRNSVPPTFVKVGDIFDDSRVVRVDRGIGVLLEIPSLEASPAYVNRIDVADEEIKRLEKRFKEGTRVRVRVVGVRHLEGLGIGTMKASAFEGSIFTHEDVIPGMLAKARILSVESHGAIVQFPSGVKALCPVSHMSEFEIAKPSKKFKVGAELLFRVLGCKSKRVTVTYKKTLVKSKLKVLASYADAVEGMVTHGWISKIEKHGCFVKFYNGVHGFAHRSELSLEPGTEATAIYHVGQVIKCRIVSSIPASRRITISFILSPKRSMETESAKLGSVVTGVVTQLTNDAILVDLGTSFPRGVIYNEHLADHHGHVSVIKSLLKPGHRFDKLLVLDTERNNMVLSAKLSLLSSKELPVDVTEVHQHSVLHGYICNLIGTGCFVRFLGRLTGFCPRKKASDEDVSSELSEAFHVGQSVRCYVANVNNDTGRISLSLEQSRCSSTDASFIENYFLIEDKIAVLQSSISEHTVKKKFDIGQVVEGVVQEIKEYGVVASLSGHNDFVGFITNFQLGESILEKGSSIRAVVVDISAAENLVDLSIKPEFLSTFGSETTKKVSSKKKRHRDASILLELHETKDAVVEMVKENYLVLSVPECNNAIGYASLVDYNTQNFPRKTFVEGQRVLVTVEELPNSSLCGRLLLQLKSLTGASRTASLKKKKKLYDIGTLVQAEITEINRIEMFLKFGIGCRGRIHITEVFDDFNPDNPFSNFKIGQVLTAMIVAKGGKGYQWEMTLKPLLISGTEQTGKSSVSGDFNFNIGQAIGGYVVKVNKDWVSLAISRWTTAQLFILDSTCEPDELEDFQSRYNIGMPTSGHVIGIDKEKKILRITSQFSMKDCGETPGAGSIVGNHDEISTSNLNVPKHIQEGNVVGGRIQKILPGVGGLLVQIGPLLYGKAHFTELVDEWSIDPLSGFRVGQFVKCWILEMTHSPDGRLHVDLSLRATVKARSSNSTMQGNTGIIGGRYEKVEELHVGMDVKGYVKNITAKGCFIMLSRKIDARVLISNLSDGYVENPETEFPVGKLVHGRILSIETLSGRVDVTLKTENASNSSKIEVSDFINLHEGDIISGNIKRIESYGLLISINNTNVVGLCHISEISDNHIDKIEGKFRAGDKVTAKILKMDPERRRISLGMKSIHLMDNDNSNFAAELRTVSLDPSLDLIEDVYGKQVGSLTRASIPPLDVKLEDDMIDPGSDDGAPAKANSSVVIDVASENSKRHLKKKEKEKRELEISAAEERRLGNDIPRTADEFEKVVRTSPNSSFLWIKYMAFLLSLAEVEKARSVAERALRTIHFREESEKLNVWVAYFNLENEYGNPREEAVNKLFERALQFCDPKKLHVALLEMYERTEQDKLAEELLQKMTKKFKTSCKVWLHYVEYLLKQQRGEIQNVVNRALLSLPHSKHIKFISHAAILEFKFGLPDRGRKLFEEILKEYPKRTDIWSVYIDQVIRLGDPEVTRALFERVTCLSLPPKKLKFLFKKYLEYEKSVGDEEKVEYVKRKALEYVESTKA